MKTHFRQTGSGLPSLFSAVAAIGLVAFVAYTVSYGMPSQKAARMAAVFDAPHPESLAHLRAIELADKQPDLKVQPGLYTQRVNADPLTLDSEVLFSDDGTFRTTIKVFENAASMTKPLFEGAAAGKYSVKGHNILFSEMTGLKSLMPAGGRLAVVNWSDVSLETAIEDKRFATYTRKADPEFTAHKTSDAADKK